ncbi:MAG: hypothetical protein QGD94_04790 [Planctomycetia bacterium]|nr:hypothetical protein [Planctomycetia bacterium]
MTQRIKTLIAVVFLTVVVWMAVDFEVTDYFECTIHDISIQAPDPNYMIEITEPAGGRLRVVFSGPRGQINRLKASPEEQYFRYVLDEGELQAGHLAISVQKGFEHLRGRRITVKSADPELVEVLVERLVRLENVRVNVKVRGAEDKKHQVEPGSVAAIVAESLLANAEAKEHIATATVELAGVEIPEGGGQITLDVTLDKYLDGDRNIPATFEPDTVTVTLAVESPVMTRTLQGIAVRVSGPPDVMSKYKVVFNEPGMAVINLKVTGPRDAVGALSPQDVHVYLELTADDKPADEPGLLRAPVVFLPLGIKKADTPPSIAFNLKERAKPGEPE